MYFYVLTCINTIFSLAMPRVQMRTSEQGEGHILLYGTLEIGHKEYPGYQRLQCWPFAEQKYYGFNREDCVFIRPPGVESFSLAPDNVWYGRLKLLFKIHVVMDGQADPVEHECAFISFFYDIRLELSGELNTY